MTHSHVRHDSGAGVAAGTVANEGERGGGGGGGWGDGRRGGRKSSGDERQGAGGGVGEAEGGEGINDRLKKRVSQSHIVSIIMGDPQPRYLLLF